MSDLGFGSIGGDAIAGGAGVASGDNEGSLSVTLGAIALSATSALPITGTLAATLDSITLSASGELLITGTLASTLDPITLSASGVEQGVTATLDPITLSATGELPITGSLQQTLGAITLAAAGDLPITGSLAATLGEITLAATDSTAMFFFAWCDEADPFTGAMLREDERIFEFEITHAEYEFPALQIDLVNPRVGLLAAGRNLWCWVSWRNGAVIEPLFHGRLIGIPENLHGEVVRLLFVARPSDYLARKTALAESLKVSPHWDPAWISEGVDDPDTAWEARTEATHIDRITLAVTSSDLNVGEDGTLTITADDAFYDSLEVGYGDTPLRRVHVNATATWTQEGEGVVDLTEMMVKLFRGPDSDSPYQHPLVSSFTGDGLLNSWPEAGSTIGAGWSMDETATIEDASWCGTWLKTIVYLMPVRESETVVDRPGTLVWAAGEIKYRPPITHEVEVVTSWETWAVAFPLIPYEINFAIKWTAARPRTETLAFTLTADAQPLLVDPGDDEEDTIELASAFLAEAVDPGGAMPIGDRRRNSYFNTDRGAQSVEYLLMLARAKLRSTARAVNITIETPFALATGLSCRKNVYLLDDRLPAGEAAGKVTKYVLSVSGDAGELKARITIGCTVGYGNTISPTAGTNTYIDDYIDGYYALTGATLDPGSGDIVYDSFDDIDVLDDDGIDLFRMTPDRVVQSLSITGGPRAQLNALKIFADWKIIPMLPGPGEPTYSADWADENTPSTVLQQTPTTISLSLIPIGSQSFETAYTLNVSELVLPQTIDLEAS